MLRNRFIQQRHLGTFITNTKAETYNIYAYNEIQDTDLGSISEV